MSAFDKQLKEWAKERDKVVKTYDVEKFKAFYRKWVKRGIYDARMPMPEDSVIEISLRKMVYHMKSATDEEKAEAKEWLEAHGSNTNI